MRLHSHHEGIGLTERARDRGLTVPGDLAVVSYDDEVAAASNPTLTAVRPPKHRLGAVAAELALARMTDPTDRPGHRLELWSTLIVHASFGGAESTRRRQVGDGSAVRGNGGGSLGRSPGGPSQCRRLRRADENGGVTDELATSDVGDGAELRLGVLG